MSLKKRLRDKRGLASMLRFQAATRSRREVRRRLRRLAPLMAPGRYALQWNLARRLRHPGEAETAMHTAFVGQNRDDHPACRLAERLPPRTVDIAPTEHAAEEPADILLIRSYATLLLLRDGRHIIRLFDDAERARKLVDNGTRLAPWLRVPQVEPFPTGLAGVHGVKESVATGSTIRSGPHRDNVNGYRDLLRQCGHHAQVATGAFGHPEDIERALNWEQPDWLARVLADQGHVLVDLLAQAPMLFSHGDCHPGNVLVDADGRARIIDLERAEWMPFFFDALYILRMQDPSCAKLRQEYFTGTFDGDLAPIWEAVGGRFDPRYRLHYLLAVSVAHSLRAQFQGKGEREQARKLRNSSLALRPFCESLQNADTAS